MNHPVKIILIEDNPGDARIVQEMLADIPDANCEISFAESIRDAITALTTHPVDAILLDLSLPDCKGLQSLHEVRACSPDVPVIVLTGLGDDATALTAVQDGAQDYLLKGEFDARTLLRSVRYAIERARSERIDRERRGLESALGAMDRLLAVIAHELRTPLTSLRLLSEYMLTDQPSAMGEWETNLTSINSEVIRMTDMVNNLLEAARLDSGVSQWNWGTVHLSTIAEQVITLLRPLTNPDRQSLSADGVPGDLSFAGDPDAVRRLLVNLVSNAIKQTRDGRIEIVATTSTLDGHDWVQIQVRDNGIGMSEHILRRLGEAFAINSGVAGSSASGGTGLGLAICKGIAGAHGGHITVASHPGQGSVFTVALRRDLAEPAPIPAEMKILREAAA